MNIEALALMVASDLLHESAWGGTYNKSGNEPFPGFKTVYNDWAGQSKAVLHHLETNLIFKAEYWPEQYPNSSRRYVGEVTFHDNGVEGCNPGTYKVRLPEFHVIDVPGEEGAVLAMEYVEGDLCCGTYGGWCEHAHAMCKATNCRDAHNGNYLIKDGEVVLFDFEGIVL